MTNQEIFHTQWLRMKEEMVEKMNLTIKGGENLSHAELNKLYKAKLLRWEGYARPEGRWLEDQQEDVRKEFLAKLHKSSLTEPAGLSLRAKSSRGSAVVGGVAAVALLAHALLRSTGLLGWLLHIVGILACLSIPVASANAKANEARRNRNEQMKKHYISQIENTGAELEAYWRSL